jgi:hypothetical protein
LVSCDGEKVNDYEMEINSDGYPIWRPLLKARKKGKNSRVLEQNKKPDLTRARLSIACKGFSGTLW